VSKIPPATLPRSTALFTASNNSGARCTSSNVTGKSSSRESGLSFACERTSNESSVKYRRFGPGHKSLTIVVFPTCLAPATTTTGKTESAFANKGSSHLELFLFTT
jgi:hypothetical protein